MVDEKCRKDSSHKGSKTSNKPNMTTSSNSQNNNNNNNRANDASTNSTRRRRSIFSVLFNPKSSSQANIKSVDGAAARDKSVGLERISMKSEICRSDIVLIRPAEARCVEATIASLTNERRAPPPPASGAIKVASREREREPERKKPLGTSDSPKARPMARLIKRRRRTRDEDADSYVLDLNDQLEVEKLRISSSSSSSSCSLPSSGEELSWFASDGGVEGARVANSSDKSRSQRFLGAQERKPSPMDGKRQWRTNENYIPGRVDKTSAPSRRTEPPPRPPPPVPRKPGALVASNRRQKSPLLQEFLTAHHIDPLAASSSDEDELNSSCDSLFYLGRLPAHSLASSLTDTMAPRAPMSDSDRRLYHWRKLAERSITMWQVPPDSSSDEASGLLDELEHDDELELMNCHSPALMCYCSDDTSCSSVELIWSRPQLEAALQRQRSGARPQAAGSRPQLGLGSPPEASPSPAKLTPSPASDRLTPGSRRHLAPGRLYGLNVSNNNNNNNNNNSSCSSLVSAGSQSQNSWRQKPGVFELAKPLRARDRRIGEWRKSDAANRDRRAPRQTGAAAPAAVSGAIDAPAESRSFSRASDNWHANPLFGHHAGESSPLAEETAAQVSRVSLRRGQSVDLLSGPVGPVEPVEANETELTKSWRFRNFLARMKRLERKIDQEPAAGEGKQSEKEPADGPASSAEQLDSFSMNEPTAFDANEQNKRHRWSLRLRAPFVASSAAEQSAHLSQHLVNLDRRIKSNVWSLRSHLSDKGKRASVLADQLISSIKDTTREQLLAATTGTSARDRYDTLPNSFATTAAPADASQTQTPSTTIDHRRAKQFALIYMHQQSQVGGQPVITRQPTSVICNKRPTRAAAPLPTSSISPSGGELRDAANEKAASETASELASMERIMDECKRKTADPEERHQGELTTNQDERTLIGPRSEPVRNAIDNCQTSSLISEHRVAKPSATVDKWSKKRLRARKTRRQFYVAQTSDDEDDQRGSRTTGLLRNDYTRRKYSLSGRSNGMVSQHRRHHVTY